MRTANTVNWDVLLDGSSVDSLIESWSVGNTSTVEVTNRLRFTEMAGEFRKLVRNNGTTYGRRLARKALRYRGVNV